MIMKKLFLPKNLYVRIMYCFVTGKHSYKKLGDEWLMIQY